MPRKKNDSLTTSRNWKLLLYPDNEIHSKSIDLLSSGQLIGYNDRLADWIGIKHYKFNSSGQQITEGEGKPHFHFVVGFSSEISNLALAARLGLMLDNGEPDLAFLRPVVGDISQPILYLTHVKYPEKEQYQEFELIGCAKYLNLYRKAYLEFQTKEISTRDCVRAVCAWIRSQSDYISSYDYAQYMLETPYFKVRNDRLVLACLFDHNQKIDSIVQAQQQELIQSGYAKLQEIQGRQKANQLLCASPAAVPDFIEISNDELADSFGLLGEPIF